MIWKLFVSILAMSDVGSVSTTAIVTDYPTKTLCEQAAVDYGQGRTMMMERHQVTIRISASCSPGSEPMRADGIPPPVAGMLRGFIEGMDQR